MEIKRVALTNFKKHHKLEFDVVPGITGIVGMNGVGKSSMLEGIYFGITGQALGDEARSNLLNWDSKDGKVEVSFVVNDTPFLLTRSINKNSATLEGFENKIVGIKGVNEAISDLMKINTEYLRDILFVAQEQLDAPLRGTESARKEAFGKLFGCTKLEKLRDIILSQNSALPFDRSINDTVLENKYQEISNKLDQLDALNEQIKVLEQQLEQFPNKDDLIYQSRLPLKSAIEAQTATLNNKVNSLKEQLAQYDNYNDVDEQKVLEEYLNLQNQYKLITNSVCPTCGTVINKFEGDPEQVKNDLEYFGKVLNDLKVRNKLNNELKEVTATLNQQLNTTNTIDDDTHATIVQQLRELQTLETNINKYKTSATVSRALIDKEISEVEQLAVKNKENKKLQVVSDQLETIRVALHRDNVQQFIRAQGAAQINERLKEIVSVFNIPHEVYFTEDGLMKFKDIESKTEHDFSSMSGGQKKLVALAYRLSLMRLFISGINICVLDEPTAFIDKDNIDAMKEAFLALNNFAKNKGLAIFIATHEERLYPIFNNIIEV